MIERKICVLPEPDSPATPRVSPAAMRKETSFTACTSPSWVAKRVSSLPTSRMAVMSAIPLSPVLGIERVAQAVADEVEGEEGGGQEERREDQHPGGNLHHVGALGDQHAPGEIGRAHVGTPVNNAQ